MAFEGGVFWVRGLRFLAAFNDNVPANNTSVLVLGATGTPVRQVVRISAALWCGCPDVCRSTICYRSRSLSLSVRILGSQLKAFRLQLCVVSHQSGACAYCLPREPCARISGMWCLSSRVSWCTSIGEHNRVRFWSWAAQLLREVEVQYASRSRTCTWHP